MDVLNKNPWLIGVLVLVAVGYVIVKRWVGEPLNARDLCAPPLILTGIGIWQLTKVTGLTGADYLWLAGGIVVGLACGTVRGATIVLFTKNGALWQRYTGRTFAFWVVTLVTSGGYSLLAHASGMHEAARPITLSIGVSLLGEMAALGLRALATGQRFSPDRRDSPAARQATRDGFLELAKRVARRGQP